MTIGGLSLVADISNLLVFGKEANKAPETNDKLNAVFENKNVFKAKEIELMEDEILVALKKLWWNLLKIQWNEFGYMKRGLIYDNDVARHKVSFNINQHKLFTKKLAKL